MASRLFTTRVLLIMGGLSAAYLLVSFWLLGFRPEQLWLVIVCNLLFFASGATRSFVSAFSIFIIYWIIFDYMKAIPNYRFHPVQIESIYLLEKKWFGITGPGGLVLTPNEYWQMHQQSWIDFMAGLFYLCWIPVPLSFAAYLYFTRRRQYYFFAFTFLLVNLIGFIIYYSCPAAPPWYVSTHGFVFDPHTAGSTAGLARFDALVHVPVFRSIYTQSSNIFAAMPSLHSAYPVIVFYYGVTNKLRVMSFVFAGVMGGIWFSAVYTGHHYVLDVLAGICCAVVGIALFRMVGNRLLPEHRFTPANN